VASDPYIRFRDPDDLGLRPPDASLYTTPAISILKPSGMGLDTDPAKAYADIDQQVHVEVSNKGTDDAAATVTVWAYGFGTSPGATAGYAGSLGGVTGTSKAVTIPHGSTGSTTAVNIDWRPDPLEVGGTERHFCIRANVFVDLNDQQPPAGSPAGTPPALDPTTNVRHAQRNMTLLPKPTTLKAIEFHLAIGNPDDERAQEFSFEVREVRGELDRNELAHLRQTRWIDRKFKEALVLRGSAGRTKIAPARRKADTVALQRGRQSGHELKQRLKANELGDVKLQLALGTGDTGAIHRFDVFQHGRHGLIGSARVMTIAVPEKLLEGRYETETD